MKLGSLVLALALAPLPATAQLLPGGRSVDQDAQRAQFNNVMLKTIRETIQAWQDGWPITTGRNRIAEQYSNDATIVQLGGPLISGNDAIRTLTDSLRLHMREATLAMTDFEASEGIAYAYGPLNLEPRNPGGATISARHLTVLKRDQKGFRIRSQLLAGPASTTWPRLPASHPSGPLTLSAMTNRGTVERFQSANDLVNKLHVAWGQSDTTTLFRLFSDNALLQLPGKASGTAVSVARADLLETINNSRELHLVTLDYDGSGRLSVLLGQYYLERSGNTGASGYFALIVMGGPDEDWRIRALVFS